MSKRKLFLHPEDVDKINEIAPLVRDTQTKRAEIELTDYNLLIYKLTDSTPIRFDFKRKPKGE